MYLRDAFFNFSYEKDSYLNILIPQRAIGSAHVVAPDFNPAKMRQTDSSGKNYTLKKFTKVYTFLNVNFCK
ncbi:MAG: hypothetical protein ABI113_09485 [Mucilaginibacter sp.]